MLRTTKWNDKCKRSLQVLENIFILLRNMFLINDRATTFC